MRLVCIHKDYTRINGTVLKKEFILFNNLATGAAVNLYLVMGICIYLMCTKIV